MVYYVNVYSLLSIISFIKEKRKILISFFLTIGILSATLDGVILVQRPQIYRSKAASPINQPVSSLKSISEFTSPKGLYKLSYDSRQWEIQNLGIKVIFNLKQEYGFGRLDVIEGESNQDLDSLTEQIIKQSPNPHKVDSVQFQGKPAYLLTYKEQVIGEDVYFYKQVVKNNNNFLIFEKRAPNLGDSNFFLDNLLSSLSLTDSASLQVKGIASLSDNLTTVQLVDLIRPSIANIVYVYCLDISNQSVGSILSRPKYNLCSLSKGSGFIVNEQGVVATNGHVVKIYSEESLVTHLLQAGGKDLSIDLIRGIYSSKGQTPTQAQVEQFYQDLNMNPQWLERLLTTIFDLTQKKVISLATTYEKYYVNVGSEPVQIDYQKIYEGDYAKAVIPSKTTLSAKLIDFNYPNKYSYEAIVNNNYRRGADVAILQIDNLSSSFPALKLGNTENLKEGLDIVVAGYPTLVEGDKDPRTAISYKTSQKPTITRGIISAVRQDLIGETIFQTDASIDHGNSGGPGFNSAGEVVGIATFLVESKSGNFNFLRDISELKDLMAKNKIENELGDVSEVWREGLAKYRDQYYHQAVKYFNQVKSKNPSHPTVDEFINMSQEAIAKGESLEGLASFIKGKNSNIMLVLFGSISIVSFMSAGFLTILPFFRQDEVY